MSLGSISAEAHETMAIAMKSIGWKEQYGEAAKTLFDSHLFRMVIRRSPLSSKWRPADLE